MLIQHFNFRVFFTSINEKDFQNLSSLSTFSCMSNTLSWSRNLGASCVSVHTDPGLHCIHLKLQSLHYVEVSALGFLGCNLSLAIEASAISLKKCRDTGWVFSKINCPVCLACEAQCRHN